MPAVVEGATTGIAAAARVGAGVAAGVVGGGLGGLAKAASNAIYGNPIMTQRKIEAWKKFQASEMRRMTEKEQHTEPVLEEINQIYENISSELKRVSDCSAEERSRLATELKDLNKWAADLKKSIDRVREVKRRFEELLGK